MSGLLSRCFINRYLQECTTNLIEVCANQSIFEILCSNWIQFIICFLSFSFEKLLNFWVFSFMKVNCQTYAFSLMKRSIHIDVVLRLNMLLSLFLEFTPLESYFFFSIFPCNWTPGDIRACINFYLSCAIGICFSGGHYRLIWLVSENLKRISVTKQKKMHCFKWILFQKLMYLDLVSWSSHILYVIS